MFFPLFGSTPWMSRTQFERNTQHYFERYVEDGDDFDGVTLEKLPDLEKLFELNIYVYRLVECEDEDTEKIEL